MDTKSLFDKNAIFTITNRQNIDNKTFHWLKNIIQEEIYALMGNF